MMPRTVAVVQARMGSSRFPGKMIARLGAYPLLEWVLRRVRRASSVDAVVLATTDSPRDEALIEIAGRLGVAAYRGSETDVLQRFRDAAEAHRADWIVRVCADNPFVDPEEIDHLIHFFSVNSCDYACNHQDRLGSRYADGFGAEILSSNLLEAVSAIATAPQHREHVTLFIWDHRTQYKILTVPAPAALAHPHLRFDVDLPDHLQQLSKLVELGIEFNTPASAIVRLALSAGWLRRDTA